MLWITTSTGSISSTMYFTVRYDSGGALLFEKIQFQDLFLFGTVNGELKLFIQPTFILQWTFSGH